MHTVQQCMLKRNQKRKHPEPELNGHASFVDERRFSNDQNTELSDEGGDCEAFNAMHNPSLRNDSVTGGSGGYPAAVQVEDTLDLIRRGYKEDATFNNKAFLEKHQLVLGETNLWFTPDERLAIPDVLEVKNTIIHDCHAPPCA